VSAGLRTFLPVRIAISADTTMDTATYENAVRRAGAEPVVFRPGSTRRSGDVAGLVLAGGVDVEPSRFGQSASDAVAATMKIDAARDELEWSLLESALSRGLPVLGICRGIQLLNVYLGGTLHLDLPSDGYTAVGHRSRPIGELSHEIRLLGGRLEGLVGDDRTVNSRHHQAIDQPGRGLTVTAISPEDGVVEAVESADGQLIGVQWHPEAIYDRSPAARAVFADLIARVEHFTGVVQ
jgi:putative glutamine amidotransferase